MSKKRRASQTQTNDTSEASGDGLKGWFSSAFPNFRAGLKNTGKNLKSGKGAFAPEGFDYSFTGSNGTPSGLKAFGKNVGRWSNFANLGMQGIDAARNISDYQDQQDSVDDLLSRIQASASANPMVGNMLTPEQLELLGQIQNGNYSNNADAGDFMDGVVGNLGSSALSALGGLAIGGLPGAAISGIGGLINGGLEGMTNSVADPELEALYRSLMNAEAQYRSMQTPNFPAFGIQQRYRDMYV